MKRGELGEQSKKRRLPENIRDKILLLYKMGHTVHEIAEILYRENGQTVPVRTIGNVIREYLEERELEGVKDPNEYLLVQILRDLGVKDSTILRVLRAYRLDPTLYEEDLTELIHLLSALGVRGKLGEIAARIFHQELKGYDIL